MNEVVARASRRDAGTRGRSRTSVFLAVSLVSIGDPRFRLPVSPFYTALIAIALVAGWATLTTSYRDDAADSSISRNRGAQRCPE